MKTLVLIHQIQSVLWAILFAILTSETSNASLVIESLQQDSKYQELLSLETTPETRNLRLMRLIQLAPQFPKEKEWIKSEVFRWTGKDPERLSFFQDKLQAADIYPDVQAMLKKEHEQMLAESLKNSPTLVLPQKTWKDYLSDNKVLAWTVSTLVFGAFLYFKDDYELSYSLRLRGN
jgi:hypothetical protein